MRRIALCLALFAAAAAQAQTPPREWLLVWVAANVSGASLPEQQRFDTKEKCDAAAGVLNDLTAKTGIANTNVPVSVRAGCIEVPAAIPANKPL